MALLRFETGWATNYNFYGNAHLVVIFQKLLGPCPKLAPPLTRLLVSKILMDFIKFPLISCMSFLLHSRSSNLDIFKKIILVVAPQCQILTWAPCGLTKQNWSFSVHEMHVLQ